MNEAVDGDAVDEEEEAEDLMEDATVNEEQQKKNKQVGMVLLMQPFGAGIVLVLN